MLTYMFAYLFVFAAAARDLVPLVFMVLEMGIEHWRRQVLFLLLQH